MPVFLFKILPLVALILLVLGVVFTAKGIAGGNKKLRLYGIGCIVLFVLIISLIMMQALARM